MPDLARAQRNQEAINLAATGDPSYLAVCIAEARTELTRQGWTPEMAPAWGSAAIGQPKTSVSPLSGEPSTEPEPTRGEDVSGETPPAPEHTHSTMHVDVELEDGKVVGAHSV